MDGSAGDLGERRVVEVRQALGPLGAVGEEQVPEAACSRFGLQVLDDLRVTVRVAECRHLLLVDRFGGVDPFVHEGKKAFLQGAGNVAQLEIHAVSRQG